MKYTMISSADADYVNNIKSIINFYNNVHNNKIKFNVETFSSKYSIHYYITIEGKVEQVDSVLTEIVYLKNY